MINAVWLAIFSFSLLFGTISGRFSTVSDAVFHGGSKAVELALTLTGIVCFWSGVMEAARAERSYRGCCGFAASADKGAISVIKKRKQSWLEYYVDEY